MADNQIRLPSGQGGLTRFSDEFPSRLEISPKTVILIIALVMVALFLLHYFGGKLLTN